jgi:alkaline phosphatase D
VISNSLFLSLVISKLKGMKNWITAVLLFICIHSSAQNKQGLISGPWAGNVELRNATIWVEATSDVKKISVKYHTEKLTEEKTIEYKGELGKEFNPVKIELNGLQMNKTYLYDVIIDGKKIEPGFTTKFTTKDLWQYRKPAPDFTFLTGSCAYFNEPVYDRPGKPYGGDSSIFETMANTPAVFHLWLGDNWYTREADYYTAWGLNYRASHDRSLPVLQKFMASMPQYAIWDDHDFGPNDMGKNYILKEASRKVFMNYSCNPSYGYKEEGIYSLVSYSDVDIFLTDDRYFRSEVDLADSIDGKPNYDKTYFGKQQMDWLKNSLLYSKATFKIIATGSQVLNPFSEYDCMRFYKNEYKDLMDFLATYKIRGVVFFSGDRHHSEVIKQQRTGLYSLYDVTNSPYTSGVGKARGEEANNSARIPGTLVEAQNFTKVSVSGNKNDRVIKVEFLGLKGEKLGEWSVNENELK